MKTRLFILISALAFGLCTSALAQDWSTGSGLMNSGSAYSSTVTPVGAYSVDPMATTASPYRGRMATMDSEWDDTEVDPGNPMPIGSTTALLLFAAGAAGVVAMRRKK